MIEIPKWVPDAIREQVTEWLKNPNYYAARPSGPQDLRDRLKQTKGPEDLKVLTALLTDERMKWVWNELRGVYDDDLRRFFFTAYDAACHPRAVQSVSEIEVLADDYATAARICRWHGETLKVAEMFDQIAKELKERAANPGIASTSTADAWRPPAIVTRRRGDEVRNPAIPYVIELGNLNRRLFGGVYYGTVATTTNVALGLDPPLTSRQVRAWADRVDPAD